MPEQKIGEYEVFVSSMYGAKTKQGMVQIDIGGHKTQWTVLDARKVAHIILEAANGAETDEAVFEFFSGLGGPDSLAMGAAVVQAIREKHNRNDQRIFDN